MIGRVHGERLHLGAVVGGDRERLPARDGGAVGLAEPAELGEQARLGVRAQLDWVEAATPRTFAFYTQQPRGTSFGTKFEGLKVSQSLPEQIGGLFHAGSVGIIMSGGVGAANYGAIAANKIDAFLCARNQPAGARS